MEAVRFLLELCLLAAVASWGLGLDAGQPARVIVGLGAAVAVAAVWGRYVAPRSVHRLDDPARFAVELALFGIGAGALLASGSRLLGGLLLTGYLLNRWALSASGR